MDQELAEKVFDQIDWSGVFEEEMVIAGTVWEEGNLLSSKDLVKLAEAFPDRNFKIENNTMYIVVPEYKNNVRRRSLKLIKEKVEPVRQWVLHVLLSTIRDNDVLFDETGLKDLRNLQSALDYCSMLLNVFDRDEWEAYEENEIPKKLNGCLSLLLESFKDMEKEDSF